jgi:GNAT superfamily N-acetyltransferase
LGHHRAPDGMTIRVERINGPATYALRQHVLRPHQTIEQVAYPGDDDPKTAHYAAVDDRGEIVGIATVLYQPPPWPTDGGPAWRLRGMAIAEGRRDQGIGALVLAAVFDHVRANGGGLFWCNARIPAVSFYRRAGLVTRGEPWVEPDIGPHIVMECLVEATPPSPAARNP